MPLGKLTIEIRRSFEPTSLLAKSFVLTVPVNMPPDFGIFGISEILVTFNPILSAICVNYFAEKREVLGFLFASLWSTTIAETAVAATSRDV